MYPDTKADQPPIKYTFDFFKGRFVSIIKPIGSKGTDAPTRPIAPALKPDAEVVATVYLIAFASTAPIKEPYPAALNRLDSLPSRLYPTVAPIMIKEDTKAPTWKELFCSGGT